MLVNLVFLNCFYFDGCLPQLLLQDEWPYNEMLEFTKKINSSLPSINSLSLNAFVEWSSLKQIVSGHKEVVLLTL